MFIEQVITIDKSLKNRLLNFLKYLLGSLIIITISTFGQAPLMLGILGKSYFDGKGIPVLDDVGIMTFFDPNLTLFLIMLTFVFGLVGVYIVIKNIHNQTVLQVTTARRTVDWNRICFSFLIWAGFTILSTGALYYISPENFLINFRLLPFLILVLIGVIMIPLQTSCEEYVFRGYLMQGFGNLARNRWFPLLMTSVIFGGMHIFNPEVEKLGYIVMIYYIGTGFLLGIMTLMDDGMELALGFHAANNLIGALLVTADWTALQTHSILKDISEPSAGFDILVPVFVVYPFLLFMYSKKYGWTNWKEKLTGIIKIEDKNSSNEITGYHENANL